LIFITPSIIPYEKFIVKCPALPRKKAVIYGFIAGFADREENFFSEQYGVPAAGKAAQEHGGQPINISGIDKSEPAIILFNHTVAR
jgi:hypothetical protein